jgi:hypothetical protein
LESICYYYLYRQTNEPKNEYIICFLLDNSKHNLDLFRNELDFYLEKHIKQHFNQNDFQSNQNLLDLLENWYDNSISYLYRSFHLLKNNNNLAVFIDEV